MFSSDLALALVRNPLVESIKLLLNKYSISGGLGRFESLSLIKSELKHQKKDRLPNALNLLIDALCKEYSCKREELVSALIEVLESDLQISKISIPTSIFTKELGILESIIKYLHEEKSLKFSRIAKFLSRSPNTISSSYNKSKEKSAYKNLSSLESISIPLEIFSNRTLTCLESVIIFLKEKNKSYKEISEILGRDQRNCRDTYLKAVKKMGESK